MKIEFEAGGRRASGKIRNAGGGGLFVGTTAIPEEGQAIALRIQTPSGSPIRLWGLVWWTTRNSESWHRMPGFGLRVLDDESEDYRRLLACL
jgi:hypothetical protein